MIQKRLTNEAPLTKLFKQTKLTIITGAEKFIKPFVRYNELRYEMKSFTIIFNGTRFAIQSSDDDIDKEEPIFLYAFDSVCTADKRNLVVDIIKILHQLSQDSDTPHVAFIPCATHSQWRSLQFHLPEMVKDSSQLLLLNWRDDTHIDLTIERGEHIGEYIPFHFDSVSCKFTELLLK